MERLSNGKLTMNAIVVPRRKKIGVSFTEKYHMKPSNILTVIIQDWSGCIAGVLEEAQCRSVQIELNEEQMKKLRLEKTEDISKVFIEPVKPLWSIEEE
jgi:hypothetical protein